MYNVSYVLMLKNMEYGQLFCTSLTGTDVHHQITFTRNFGTTPNVKVEN